MKLSLIAARSKNNVIGHENDIPWKAKGEQLLFKALTYNQWLLVGRKTFESMGVLPNRKYAIVTRQEPGEESDTLRYFNSIESALEGMAQVTDHLIVGGGGQIYAELIERIDTLHLSTIDIVAEGAVKFPELPRSFKAVFGMDFQSNLNYRYEIYQK